MSARTAESLTGTPRISVVCPFYNEAAIIGDAALQMVHHLEGTFGDDVELILVNDGSTDASVDVLLAALAKHPDPAVRVLSITPNRGRGRALKTGIEAARGQVIVTTEVDGSWGETIVDELVEVLDEHPDKDFVVASPHLRGSRGLVNVPAHRRMLTRLGNRLIRLFFASGLTMNTGMTRAYRRDVIQPLVTYENGKEFHLEVLLKLLTMGFRPVEIPATITWQSHKTAKRRDRRKSSTKIWRTIGTHLKFVAIAQPVRQFAALALLAFVVGAAFMIAGFYNLLTGGPSVFYALVGMLMLLFCLLFIGFSVLFFQFRNFMREQLLQGYPSSARPGTAVSSVPLIPPRQRPVAG